MTVLCLSRRYSIRCSHSDQELFGKLDVSAAEEIQTDADKTDNKARPVTQQRQKSDSVRDITFKINKAKS